MNLLLGSQGLPPGLVIGDQRTVGLHDWRPEREVHAPRVNSGGWHPRTAFCVPPGCNLHHVDRAQSRRCARSLTKAAFAHQSQPTYAHCDSVFFQ